MFEPLTTLKFTLHWIHRVEVHLTAPARKTFQTTWRDIFLNISSWSHRQRVDLSSTRITLTFVCT